ncbi:MAG: hypothetical protein CSA11_04715 [Chloroflexi bacterium]|nr:MAG: hypothetical protein CSB13_11550 [Chloroflexota bacterium]PIE81299.1 MAG: hypothetical protein CSA11_04715 [Chloroflexota bacterium]
MMIPAPLASDKEQRLNNTTKSFPSPFLETDDAIPYFISSSILDDLLFFMYTYLCYNSQVTFAHNTQFFIISFICQNEMIHIQ